MSSPSPQSVRDASGIDLEALHQWMIDNVAVADGALTLNRIGLGQSNLTYRVRDRAGRSWALRRPPLGEILDSAHDVVREARIVDALAHSAVPVARIHAVFEPDVVARAAPAVLMSWVDGLVLDTPEVVDAMSAEHRRMSALSLVRAMAAVHAVDLEKTGLSTLASHRPYAARQLKRWSEQWKRSQTRALPALDALTARLSDATPEQTEVTLVHGDLHQRNVITNRTRGDVEAVLDWELSTLGEPLADLGSLFAYWPEPGEPGIYAWAPSALPGFPSRSELTAEYACVSGRSTASVGYWHVLGLWKLAIIGEGVMRRAIDDPRNRAADGTPTPERIAAIVDYAHRVATDAGI